MRRSVPSWQKGGNFHSQAWLVQLPSHIHHMTVSIHQAHYEMHQWMKHPHQSKHAFPVAGLIPPASEQEHPRGFSWLRVILIITCESIDLLCFVAYRTFLPAKLATDCFSCT